MPTGYTAGVSDGTITDFRSFALRCARAFGATVMQRDNPLDELPKHREESSFYADDLKRLRAELSRLEAMTVEDADHEAKAEHARLCAEREEWRARDAEVRSRYEAMMAEVLAWQPPTSEHEGLKDFMEDQLRSSLQFDCHTWEDPELLSGDAWLLARLEVARRSFTRAEESLEEERRRVAGANAWIDALYASLPSGQPAEAR